MKLNKFEKLKQVLNLNSDLIGVKLIYEHNKRIIINPKFKVANKIERYCEFVKRASKGEFLKIKKGDFSCHTADVMLGFQDSDNIELTMKLEVKGLKYILLFPINKFQPEDYDSIILILNPHDCMKLIEAYVGLYKKPLKITCGAINGVCSEVTAYVIKRSEVNFSFLCLNSRGNGIFSDCELLCGIPAKMTDDLIDQIIRLTLERKRTKNALLAM
ncbi:MAG: DUF169 domain-containing protein [Candidatus Hodarchaeota archaeon]